jgi:hypothetical protein
MKQSPITIKSGKSIPSDNFKTPSQPKTPLSAKQKINMHMLQVTQARLAKKSPN